MKKFIVLITLVYALILPNNNCFSQIEKFIGNYEFSHGGEDAFFEYKLTLNSDGTFLFHSHKNIKMGIPPIENKYGKGHWTSEKSLIFFTTTSDDISEKYSLDLNGSKARFDSKSPRNKSKEIIKTKIRFYESEIFWVKGKTLIKTN